jgi:hypothetical protein
LRVGVLLIKLCITFLVEKRRLFTIDEKMIVDKLTCGGLRITDMWYVFGTQSPWK